MPTPNSRSESSFSEISPSHPEAKLIILDEYRKQLQDALTPEQRFASASASLKGLDPDLIRTLAAHSVFSDQSPDPQWLACAQFNREGNGPDEAKAA